MRMIILAAGKGTRLRPLTDNTPKSLIDLGNGSTMLEQQIKGAIKCRHIREVVIITGYRSEQIEAKVKGYRSDIPIQIVYNPFYDISNNLFSLWTAQHLMQNEDFIITNGDNIYEDSVYQILNTECEKEDGIRVCINFKDEFDDDDMKVSFDSDGSTELISKKIPKENIDAESVGLTIIKGEKYRKLFRNKLLNLVRQEENKNKFWLEIFNSLASDGVSIRTFEVDPGAWQEVDFHPDIDDLKKLIMAKKKK